MITFHTDRGYAMMQYLIKFYTVLVAVIIQVLSYFIIGHWTLIFSYIHVIMCYEFIKYHIKDSKNKYDKYGMLIKEEQ